MRMISILCFFSKCFQKTYENIFTRSKLFTKFSEFGTLRQNLGDCQNLPDTLEIITLKNWESVLRRRDFVKLVAQGGLALFMSGCAPRILSKGSSVLENESTSSESDFMSRFGPIDRLIGTDEETRFAGDRNERPHRILWNRDRYLSDKDIQGEVEYTDVLIVGGGVSGLSTAYQLRKYKPIVLEQARRFGGNAKGQSWNGIDYGIGSAYIDMPYPGTPMGDFYRDLDLDRILAKKNIADPVEVKGVLYPSFWNGDSETNHQDSYKRLSQFLQSVWNEERGPFPLIPSLKSEQRDRTRFYDQWSLHSLLAQEVGGGVLPDHMDKALEHYCWSTYAASSREISAAAALNFLAQESGTVCVGAGGNGKIVERLLTVLRRDVPDSHLRASSLVLKVKSEKDGCEVLYEDSKGALRKVRAKLVVLACPKFVVARVLDEIEPERLKAIRKLRYRSYMTAAVLVRKKMESQYYDIFMTGEGKTRYKNIAQEQEHAGVSDILFANFAYPQAQGNVITLFRPFPFEGARPLLNQEHVFQENKQKMERLVEQRVLPLLNLKPSDVADIRLTLWGHALPLAAQGIFSDSTVEQLRKPFKERVFFVEQDNWVYPSLQTGVTEAALLRSEMVRVLDRS